MAMVGVVDNIWTVTFDGNNVKILSLMVTWNMMN